MAAIGWDRSILPAGLIVETDGATVRANGGGSKCATVQSHVVLSSGVQRIRFEAVDFTPGQWSVAVGAVPLGTDTTGEMCPIGYGGAPAGEGWGYFGHDGAKNHRSFGGTMYGPSWHQGSIITCTLDFDAGTVSFAHDDQPLGVAYSDLKGPVRPAACIFANRGAIKILDVTKL